VIRLDDPRRIGAIVADLRAMSLLTQRQICDATGMHEARLSDWERGAAIPTLPLLLPVLAYLGYQLHITPGPDEERRPTGTGWPA
jgi:transcriptional regulator with XRE-family HTH domain